MTNILEGPCRAKTPVSVWAMKGAGWVHFLLINFQKNISCIVINKVARYFHENRLTVQGFTRQELSLVLARSDFYITTDDTFCS